MALRVAEYDEAADAHMAAERARMEGYKVKGPIPRSRIDEAGKRHTVWIISMQEITVAPEKTVEEALEEARGKAEKKKRVEYAEKAGEKAARTAAWRQAREERDWPAMRAITEMEKAEKKKVKKAPKGKKRLTKRITGKKIGKALTIPGARRTPRILKKKKGAMAMPEMGMPRIAQLPSRPRIAEMPGGEPRAAEEKRRVPRMAQTWDPSGLRWP